MKVISVCNQKGGVGKTTTALTLQAGLTEKGLRTLLIDLDGQRNSTATKGRGAETSVYDVLKRGADITEAISESPTGDYIQGARELSYIEGLEDTALRDTIKPLHRKYDIAIIDAPPNLGELTINALVASDYCIIPAVADKYSGYGMLDLERTIKLVRSEYKRPKVMGILLTMHNARLRLSQSMTAELEDIAKELNTTLFDTSIRYSVKAREAQFESRGLLQYAPRAPITADYRAFIAEVIQRLK